MENNLNDIMQPLIGGVLIGLSSTIMLGLLGRVTGISGILSSTLSPPNKEHWWRYSFLIGLILGGVLIYCFWPEMFIYDFEFPILKVVIAGLFVGFGTSLGSGCTSGHGVCGLARFSKRSLTATLTFMLFGIITVYLVGNL